MVCASETPLTQVLDTLAEELQLAVDEVDWLELRLGVGSAGAPAFEAQALDFLLQHLQGVSLFARRLSCACDPDWLVRPDIAAAPLTLSAQKVRLGGGDAEPATMPAGEFELF